MPVVTWNDCFEIVILWVGIYVVLRSLRGSRGLGILKGGVGFIVGLYLVFKLLLPLVDIYLARLTYLIESLATATLIAFVIIFQPEVRRGLTRLGERPTWLVGRPSSPSVSPIVEAAGRMSRRRIGALVVIERSIGIGSIIESGVPLSAEVSAPLLESIFYPNAPLHDGAVVIRGNAIVAASCLLPLSDDPDLGTDVGTRHRAAVGLSEECDGLSVVVSEQTGRISLAYRGILRSMRDTRDLEATLDLILAGTEPEWAEHRGSDSRTDFRDTVSTEDDPTKRAIIHVEGESPPPKRKVPRGDFVVDDEKTQIIYTQPSPKRSREGESGRSARSTG